MDFRGANILSVRQFEIEDIRKIFDLAHNMEKYASRQKTTSVLNGAILSNLFFEPSTRSRISFGSAFNRLGGSVRDTTGFTFSSIVKGESLYDTARVIGGYSDVIVMRHPELGSVAKFSEGTNVPIINGGDGVGEHPTQALLDLYTIFKERGYSWNNLDNLNIAMVGDLKNGRTVHSLAKLLTLFKNVNFVLISPRELEMPGSIVEFIKNRNHQVHVTDNFDMGIRDVDVIYTTRIQEERFESIEEYKKHRGIYNLNHENYHRLSKKGAVIMHPLPRDGREGANEIDNDLNKLPQLAIFRQADNGIPIRMALFAMVLDVVEHVEKYERQTLWFVPKTIDKL